MSAKNHLSKMTMDVPEEDHRRLKTLAAVLGKTMGEIVIEWIHENLYSINRPNTDDFFKTLDI